MCQKRLYWFRCRHFFIELEECGQKCGQVATLPPTFYSFDCIWRCCELKIQEQLDNIIAYERYWGIPHGARAAHRPQDAPSAGTISRSTDTKKIDEGLHDLQRSLDQTVDEHVFVCCKQHSQGNFLTNERKKAMGWKAHVTNSIRLPQNMQNIPKYAKVLDEWQNSHAYKKDDKDFHRASAALHATNPYEIPPDTVPRASGSGAYEFQQLSQRNAAVEQRAAEDQRHNEEAELARELYPVVEERMLLGHQPRGGYTAVSTSSRGSRESSSERSGRAPLSKPWSKQSSKRDPSAEPISLFAEENEEQNILDMIRHHAMNFRAANQYEVTYLHDNLRQLGNHLQNVHLIGPEPNFHGADYVLRMEAMYEFSTQLVALEHRLASLRDQGHLSPADHQELEARRRNNDVLIIQNLQYLLNWVDTASQEVYALIVLYQTDAQRLELAREARKAAQQARYMGEVHRRAQRGQPPSGDPQLRQRSEPLRERSSEGRRPAANRLPSRSRSEQPQGDNSQPRNPPAPSNRPRPPVQGQLPVPSTETDAESSKPRQKGKGRQTDRVIKGG